MPLTYRHDLLYNVNIHKLFTLGRCEIMSYAMYIEAFGKENYKNEEKMQHIEKSLISYSKDINEDEYDEMAKGYKEMASLNLEYAEMGSDGIGFNEYVNWLSGE